MAKNNQDVERINEESHPEAGTRYLARKRDDETDALGYSDSYNREGVRDAKEVEGTIQKCLDAQLGRGDHSASKTGGKLGDATNHPQAGGCTEDE